MKKLGLILFGSFVLSANLQAGAIRPNDTCEELLRNESLTQTVKLNIGQLAGFPGDWAQASQQIMHGLIVHCKNPNLDFAYFEQFFRANNVPLYLVASSEPLAAGWRISYSNEMAKLKGTPAKYHLWIGVNGKQEADALKASLGISDEENLIRLKDTGSIALDKAKNRPFNPEDN